MDGTLRTHENLLAAFPGAISAKCDGHGWAEVQFEGEGGRGRQGRCPACEQDRTIAAITAFVPPRFRQTVEVPAAVLDWARRGRTAQGLYLAGQVGTGKTHAAWTALARWCEVTNTVPRGAGERYDIRTKPTVIFTRMTDLLDDLRPGEESRQRVRDCQETGLLVLDDLGAEKPSEWTQERLYSIVDHRYANCLPLIVTGNLPPGKLADQTGDRVASRLAEMCQVVPMTGTDRRRAA